MTLSTQALSHTPWYQVAVKLKPGTLQHQAPVLFSWHQQGCCVKKETGGSSRQEETNTTDENLPGPRNQAAEDIGSYLRPSQMVRSIWLSVGTFCNKPCAHSPWSYSCSLFWRAYHKPLLAVRLQNPSLNPGICLLQEEATRLYSPLSYQARGPPMHMPTRIFYNTCERSH